MKRSDDNIKAKVILDSLSRNNNRLTTMVVTMPRMILAEFNTHRMFSRNTSSSRAIPAKKLRDDVKNNPFIPSSVGSNNPGMQSNEEVSNDAYLKFLENWKQAADQMIACHETMEGIHKQICNRIIEPWMYCTVIVTATEWANFFSQRCHKDAQPEMMVTAFKMLQAYVDSEPVKRSLHIPFIESIPSWLPESEKIKVSIAACARVSYNRDGVSEDYEKDIELYDKLESCHHMSPFEHVAYDFPEDIFIGNFRGWVQHRKRINSECVNKIDFSKLLKSKPEWI
jgi:thymidylate synthase ThyX